MLKKDQRRIIMGSIAFVLGVLIVVQWRSFTNLAKEQRDVQNNVFREIQILKQTNENLRVEINDLRSILDATSDQASILAAIEQQINKYRILAGEVDVSGPGIKIEISGDIDGVWLIDLVNELFNGGAEAISVNTIRVTDQTQGFEMLPQGQIFFYTNTLEAPYTFEVIGEPAELEKIMNQEGGILTRIKEKYPNLKVVLTKQEKLQIKHI